MAVAYLELRDLATDLNIGTPAMTPLEFTHAVMPDDDHLELAWLVTRALWGDLQRDCQEADVAAAVEVSQSLRRRLKGAQPPFNRVLGAVSRASLRRPASDEVPNAWWSRPRLSFHLARLRPATATAMALMALVISGCAQGVPLQGGDRSGMPAKVVPTSIDGYRFVREKAAEKAFDQAGRNALVERGQVYTVHDVDDNVLASVEVAPFKRALLDDGRQRELKDSLLSSLGTTSAELKRIGDVVYRRQALADRTNLLYLPSDMTYLVLLTARPTFDAAETLLGKVVNYQRGVSDLDRRVPVAELPNPLRGVDP